MSDNHTIMLLEDMNSKFDGVVEAVGQLQDQVQTLAKQTDLDEVKADIKVIKAAVIDSAYHAKDNDKRITRLEATKSRG